MNWMDRLASLMKSFQNAVFLRERESQGPEISTSFLGPFVTITWVAPLHLPPVSTVSLGLSDSPQGVDGRKKA